MPILEATSLWWLLLGCFGGAIVSALVGVPPFYVVSVVAGALRLSFAAFLAVGGLGRLAHFGLLAAAPHLARRWF